MTRASVAFFWHQHQPYYPDDLTGETLMPWVRLHGTKDYIGMALHIQEVPEFRCTINLVPSLVAQIQRYVRGGSDRHLDVSRAAADGLDRTDALYLLDHFFMANPANMIDPFPRYRELYHKRAPGRQTAENCVHQFTPQEFRDLQVWSNLTWIHDLVFEQDAELRRFRAKGRDWTEAEKGWLLERQREIMARILPLHAELAAGGQVELTTTPFYHPILPLLWDKRSARQAMPQCDLPKYLDSYKEDAREQLRRGVALHQEVFGTKPRGMWPSEGSVSQDILPAIAETGIEWIATDEEILSHSTDQFVHRTSSNLINRPEMLYRPWRVEAEGANLQVIFRDHGLSDLIGFEYQRNADSVWAAKDLVAKCSEINRICRGHQGDSRPLIPIILDGENCWEYYKDGGVTFLRTLYREAAASQSIEPVRVQDHLDRFPATDKINRLFAGSWINHDFYIWIGHREDRDAWDALHLAREVFANAEKEGGRSAEILEQARRELMIAEGSDWFWWYGDDHSSAQDALFDQLFRRHLQNIYQLLGEPVPSHLFRPIKRLEKRIIHSQPRSLLKVVFDGRRNYFDWLMAGVYTAGSERGTMTKVTTGAIRQVYFGFDARTLLVRVDTAGRAIDDLQNIDELRVRFLEPDGTEVRFPVQAGTFGTATALCDGVVTPCPGVQVAVRDIVEIGIPLEPLGIAAGAPLQVFIEIFSKKQSLDRAPGEGVIETVVPSVDFNERMWQV